MIHLNENLLICLYLKNVRHEKRMLKIYEIVPKQFAKLIILYEKLNY